MDAVVTGGAGFIGSHVADALLERGGRVAVIDNLSGGRRDRVPDGTEFHELDIRDHDAMQAVFDDVQPAAVFHLAAQADVRASVEDPGFDADVNVRGTIVVLECARSTGARVVFSSTGGALYGEAETIPSPEAIDPAPMSPYGTSKQGAELYLGLFNRLYGTRHVVLRYSNVYGPRQDPHGEAGVVAIFLGKLTSGETPLIFGDGRQTRDYVYVGDVVAANMAALAYEGPHQAFNIGTQTETDVIDLLAESQRVAGTDVTPEHRGARLGELDRSCLDIALARRELGWQPAVPLGEGLAETLRALHP
ncbi:MAG TPA: NAD-dependent epimerase/dehydratase family protein [Gaiellales bacterium]|nr:NAD-dependent epimerase/dehydratase family protein [Gaiellales bacterium]